MELFGFCCLHSWDDRRVEIWNLHGFFDKHRRDVLYLCLSLFSLLESRRKVITWLWDCLKTSAQGFSSFPRFLHVIAYLRFRSCSINKSAQRVDGRSEFKENSTTQKIRRKTKEKRATRRTSREDEQSPDKYSSSFSCCTSVEWWLCNWTSQPRQRNDPYGRRRPWVEEISLAKCCRTLSCCVSDLINHSICDLFHRRDAFGRCCSKFDGLLKVPKNKSWKRWNQFFGFVAARRLNGMFLSFFPWQRRRKSSFDSPFHARVKSEEI